MKKLTILLLTAFFTNGLLAQNSGDPQMLDTLTNEKNGDKFLKVYSWSNEDGKQGKNENSFMLRKNTKYAWRVGNSAQSETSIIFEVEANDVKIGNWESNINEEIEPGEVSKFDVTIPVTGSYNVKLSSTREGSVCSHVAVFFVEKYPDE